MSSSPLLSARGHQLRREIKDLFSELCGKLNEYQRFHGISQEDEHRVYLLTRPEEAVEILEEINSRWGKDYSLDPRSLDPENYPCLLVYSYIGKGTSGLINPRIQYIGIYVFPGLRVP